MELNYPDLNPVEIPVTLGDKKYVLREATEDTATSYRDMILQGVRFVDGKMSGATGLAKVEPWLVSRCLFDAATSKQVPVSQVMLWKPSIVKDIFENAKRISGLDEVQTKEQLQKILENTQKQLDLLSDKDGGDPGKNSPDATGITS